MRDVLWCSCRLSWVNYSKRKRQQTHCDETSGTDKLYRWMCEQSNNRDVDSYIILILYSRSIINTIITHRPAIMEVCLFCFNRMIFVLSFIFLTLNENVWMQCQILITFMSVSEEMLCFSSPHCSWFNMPCYGQTTNWTGLRNKICLNVRFHILCVTCTDITKAGNHIACH